MPCVCNVKIRCGKSNKAGKKDFVRMPADIAGGMKIKISEVKNQQRSISTPAKTVDENLAPMVISSGSTVVIIALLSLSFGVKKMEFKNVRLTKICDLKPHPKNPRVHPDSALSKLVKSINKFGFTNPVLVSKDGFILAGHARCKAAQKAGIEEVPAIFLDLEGADADAYLIADNKIQEETDWDKDLLAELIKDLQTLDFDVSFTGFEPPEIDQIMTSVHNKDSQEDDFDVDAALEEESFVKPGDLWHLGKHRLMCGDATKAEDVAILMNGKMQIWS